MSLSKNQLKLITSLGQKKYRVKHNLFIAEGTKVVNEFLNSTFQLEALFCVDDSEYKKSDKVFLISITELKKISNLSTPNNVLAIFGNNCAMDSLQRPDSTADPLNQMANRTHTLITRLDWKFPISPRNCIGSGHPITYLA